MSSATLYNARKDNISLDAELGRLHNQANMNVAKESRILTACGLRDGMSVLEVGSGPGFVTEWLSALVPNGSITCVEIDPVLVKHAEEYLRDRAKCKCSFVAGSATKTDLPDNAFDFAYTRLVFEHLTEPLAAAGEILRMLKPGGTAVFAEGDFSLNSISNPFVPEAERIREKIVQLKKSHGGNAMAARRMWFILKSAGFRDIDYDAIVFHSGEKGLDGFYPQFDPDRVKALVKMGVVSDEEYKEYCAGIDGFLNSEEAFFMRVLPVISARKPEMD